MVNKQQRPTVRIDAGIVSKTYPSDTLAAHFTSLYNSFPHHVKAHKVGDSLRYDFVEGTLLSDMLRKAPEKARAPLVRLAKYLASAHSQGVRIRPGYEAVCERRAHFSNPQLFMPSGYYSGWIHGDLNTRNIIVTETGDTVLIDRMKERGDILFDFTFVMSMICLFEESQDTVYLTLLEAFLLEYALWLSDPHDFFVSFRNNFMNYGYLVANDVVHQKQFPEWAFGKSIAINLASHPDFLSYLHAQYSRANASLAP